MPWGKKTVDGKICVYKKADNHVLHCYSGDSADEKANKYLAALHMHSGHKEYVSLMESLPEVAPLFLAGPIHDAIMVQKEDDGRWRITTVSSAAMKDREGETFDEDAMDYDISIAEDSGEYPEFRLFHTKGMGIGKVEKMRRAGIFIIDEGHSYDDPFSQAVAEKMLAEGDYRCSRGFYVLEAKGGCPKCGESLVIKNKHMVAGFRCPTCKSVHLSYKGVLKDLHFRKVRTFDVTITDNPAVPWTGVIASKFNSDSLEDTMTKKQLKEKLLAAGINEKLVDEKLKEISDERLKELDDIPEATLLKEFGEEEEEETSDGGEQVFVLDEEVLREFAGIVRKEVAAQLKEALEGMELEIGELEGFDVNLKELPQMAELLATVKTLNANVEKLLSKDEIRLQKALKELPRGGKLRISRFKAKDPDEEDEDMEEEDEGEDEEEPKKKFPFQKKALGEGAVVGSDGKEYPSMTSFILGGKE